MQVFDGLGLRSVLVIESLSSSQKLDPCSLEVDNHEYKGVIRPADATMRVPAGARIPFLVAAMLLTGVCNTLITKYQVGLSTRSTLSITHQLMQYMAL